VPLPMGVTRTRHKNSTSEVFAAKFPKIIHNMWKSASLPPPTETLRWKKGCKAVNPDHEFKMYYDADLLDFVKKSYPQYLALFQSLKGVYMADMARVLVMYHYGGIYTDLDFYCHRPFTCIVDSLLPQTQLIRKENDILIVSLEPKIHANIFRDKDRVVIQDFYMATVRHPFFKWFLEDRLRKFEGDPSHPTKGPFSYSIEKEIDEYKASLTTKGVNELNTINSDLSKIDQGSAVRLSKSNSSKQSLNVKHSVPAGGVSVRRKEGNNQNKDKEVNRTTSRLLIESSTPSIPNVGYIHELREDMLHSLVDSTNSRLDVVCSGNGDKDGKPKGHGDKKPSAHGIPLWAVKSCEKVKKREYFSPSEYTVAVHMWTHTFLGWSFVRGLYNSRVYSQVERKLPPTMRCPPL